MPETAIYKSQESSRAGIAYAFGAFILWGLSPVYFKELSHVDAMEFLVHRMGWSFLFLVFLLFFRRTIKNFGREIYQISTDKKLLLLLFLSAILISSNWLVFIWAVSHDKVMETSLGYFINPLMNVALGMLVLGERLSRVKLIAVFLAFIGVLYMVIEGGEFPWIALYLAASFAIYGLIRKKIHIGALIALWVEMLILLPFAVVYMIYISQTTPEGAVGYDNYTLFMLILSGAVTAVPLVFFTSAAKRLPLSTIGLIQYIAPTLSLLLAVFLWHEPFTRTHLITFVFIWSGLVIYSMDSFSPFHPKITK